MITVVDVVVAVGWAGMSPSLPVICRHNLEPGWPGLCCRASPVGFTGCLGYFGDVRFVPFEYNK